MFDQEKLDEMMRTANKGDVDEATVSKIMNNLSENDRKKVNDILNDKEKLNKILSNPSVKDLLNRFKNNG